MEHLNASDHARGVCRNETREHYQGAVGRVIDGFARENTLRERAQIRDWAGLVGALSNRTIAVAA